MSLWREDGIAIELGSENWYVIESPRYYTTTDWLPRSVDLSVNTMVIGSGGGMVVISLRREDGFAIELVRYRIAALLHDNGLVTALGRSVGTRNGDWERGDGCYIASALKLVHYGIGTL